MDLRDRKKRDMTLNDINNYEMDKDTETGANIRRMLNEKSEDIDEVDDFALNFEEIITKAIDVEDMVEAPKQVAYRPTPNRIIAIGSMWQGAGSTTIAMNLARALSVRGLNVAFMEFPLSKPYMFDYLAIHSNEKLQGIEYVDYARRIHDGKSIRKKESVWNAFGVDWFVNDSRHAPLKNFTCDDMLKYIYSINSSVTVVDLSSNLGNLEVQQFLHHVDNIYICMDSDPIKIDWLSSIPNSSESEQREEKKIFDYLCKLENEGINYNFVSMKHTKVIDNKYIWENLGKQSVSLFPIVNLELLVKLAWNSKFLYDESEYQEKLEEVLKPIIVESIPKEYHELKRAKKGLLKSLFSK